jgi:folate-binding protein YgfZ
MEQDYYIKNTFSKFIEISGEDRINFLQGIITNDINKCTDKNNCIYSCFLSPQGKFLADFFITNFDNYYLLEINEKFFESFFAKLKIYKLRSRVEFKENTNLISFVFFCKKPPPINKNIILYSDPRKDNLGDKAYIDKNSSDLEVIAQLKELKFDLYKEKLMRNLVPNSPTDLLENKSLLLENNFQNINAIDWDKGCYIGQEITARMKYRSLLKKKLYVLELLSGNINPNDNIIEKDINIGNVKSRINNYLLCMLKISLVENKSINKEIIKIFPSTQIKFL